MRPARASGTRSRRPRSRPARRSAPPGRSARWRAKAAAVRGAWSSLVSTSRQPPGASQCGAAAATRRRTSSPSAPPSSATRGSCTRASGGISRDRVGRHVGRVGDQDVDAPAQRVRAAARRGRPRTRDRRRRRCAGRTAPRPGRRRRRAARPGPAPRPARRPPRPTAAQVDDDGPGPRRRRRPGGRGTRYGGGARRPRVHGDPQAAELRPAEDVFEGQPATRRSTMAASSAGVRAAERSSRASSSAKTQPAARSLATIAVGSTVSWWRARAARRAAVTVDRPGVRWTVAPVRTACSPRPRPRRR